MPAYQILLDRRNVPKRVCTDWSKLPSTRSDHKGNSFPTSNEDGIEEVPRTPLDARGPRQFIPYLYLFSPPTPGSTLAGNWTHTLRLLPSSRTRPAGTTDLVSSRTGGSRGLDLYISGAAFQDAGALHLSAEHLLLARDFLALALPYYASAHPTAYFPSPFAAYHSSSSSSPLSSSETLTPISHCALEGMGPMVPPAVQQSRADPVRVLILGPPRVVLAIGLTYIAYASGCGVAHAMRGVLEGDGDAEWCRLLGDDGEMGLDAKDMKMLERVAVQEM
ncbi:hypothetical protein DFH07DRAFT_859019 [Mycena maculata]|uniref:Uncharacterized protein n=1 Tax=Mycena maculata TaxID=230809 RepID=A0AAD7HGG5_9AGAR|nr:hypothetical protein DFH07DRAFT_859019 [Mycena maculata]